MTSRPLSRCVATLIMLAALGARARSQTAVSAAWLRGLDAAANAKDAAALRSSTAPGIANDYDWATAPGGMLGRSKPWRAAVLSLPGAQPGDGSTFVTFSRYQHAESTGDHLYRTQATKAGVRLGAEIPENDLLGTRVRHHRFLVRLDVPLRRVSVTDHVTLDRTLTDFPAILLRINSIYTMSAVKRNGEAVPFRQSGGFVAVQASAGEGRVDLDLTYSGMADVSNEDFVRPDHAALTGYWYVHTGRMPASSDVRITVPRGWSAIGQGEPAGKTVTATTSTFLWENRLPVSYITVAAGRYAVTSRRVGSVIVSAYLLKANAARAQEAIDTAGSAIAFFSRIFSPFPYKRYAVVETSVFPAALECYSFTLVGNSLIPEAIVHEVAHTWWGGIVPNTYTRSLWNESFAEYSDGLYGRINKKPGLHEFNTKLMSQSGFVTKRSLLNSTDAADMEQSMLGYGKGSLVLENLERMLGTQTMLACLRYFIVRHAADRAGEDADWPDIVDAFSQAAGPAWRGYFMPWLSSTNLPTLRFRNVTSHPQGSGFVVEGTVSQAEPAHWIQVPLVVRTTSGSADTHTLNVKQADEPFRIELKEKPVRITLDPKNEALRAMPKAPAAPELLSYQTHSGPLLVVYATGGSPAETAVAREVAEQQAKEVFPFATVAVKPDSEVTESSIADTNVLLIGRIEELRIPSSLVSALRLHAANGTLRMGTRSWNGADLWGLDILTNPANPKRLLGHVAAASPGALRGFRRQGDLEARNGWFIVQGSGNPVASGKADPAPGDAVLLDR